MSTTWCASLWSLVEAAWPVMATIGARSRYASAMPVMRFVAPGPRVRHRHRGPSGQPAMDVGHERGALLVAGRDVADALVARQRVEDVHRLLAGHGEDEVAALGREAVDEEVGSSPRRIAGHDRSVGRPSVRRAGRVRPAVRSMPSTTMGRIGGDVMGQEIVLFHSALGLRPAVLDFADALRADGRHRPHPRPVRRRDVRRPGGGRRQAGLRSGSRRSSARARAAVETLAGRSGVRRVLDGHRLPAELVAATRPGARAAILMHGVFAPADYGIPAWPGIPAEIHYAAGDPEVDEAAARALADAVRASGAPVTVHTS